MLFSTNHCPELKGLQDETCRDDDSHIENKSQGKSAHVYCAIGERLSDPRIGIDGLHCKQYGTDNQSPKGSNNGQDKKGDLEHKNLIC